jgi:uncharacterized membrane protein (UPF0127 family)
MNSVSKMMAGAVLVCAASFSAVQASAACRQDAVLLRGDWGSARFSVEIADDPAEQAQGLMHRAQMPSSAGMLFVYAKPQRTSFWMRNTLIPLDMLFLDERGVVAHIHHNAIPLDETPIPGGDNVLAVLEINGGLARRMGITEGSEMRHPAFAKFTPNWPC